MSYRHMVFIDYSNIFQRGNSALVSMSGKDKQKCLVVAESLENFMCELYNKMTSGYFYRNPKNEIQSFPADVKNE